MIGEVLSNDQGRDSDFVAKDLGCFSFEVSKVILCTAQSSTL
jgi:hypothetical protein